MIVLLDSILSYLRFLNRLFSCSAAGLYYLAEIVEEYTVASKKVIWWMSVVSICHTLVSGYSVTPTVYTLKHIMSYFIFLVFQISLVFYVCFILFEEFPISMNACGILAHLNHLLILNSFPVVVLSSPQFLLAIIMLVVNHYLAFSYFGSVYHPFSEVSYQQIITLFPLS